MASKNPSTKTIIFKCDQHSAIISETLQNFYEQNEFFDTVLIAGSNSVNIQAHRVVLCAMSKYILEIFRGDHQGNKVELKEIEAPILKTIIKFMYSGSIKLSVGTVEQILRAASFLKIKSLADCCCKMIEKNIDFKNSLSWFRLGYELSIPTLKITAEECIYTHFEKISKNKELLMLSENELKDLLFNDNPYRDLEENVCWAMAAWLNFDILNRKHLVPQLLSMVRFQILSPMFIVENRKSVCTTVQSYELICSWLQWHLSPETRSIDQGHCMEARSNIEQDSTLMPRKVTEKTKKLAVVRASFAGPITIETFNPNENEWSTEIETLRRTNSNLTTTLIVIDGKLIAPEGKDKNIYSKSVEVLDLYTSEWIDLPLMKQKKDIWQMADLKGNLCVVGSGFNDKLVSIDIYSFSTHKWLYVKPLAKISYKVKIATLDEMLYILDFEDGYLQSYNVSSNKWILKKIEKDSLLYYEFAAVEGLLYIIGGYSFSTNKWVKTVKRFNLSDDSWCEVASLPSCTISGLRSTVFENKIIVTDSENVFEYNPDSDTWNTLSAINTKIYTRYTFHICNLTVNS